MPNSGLAVVAAALLVAACTGSSEDDVYTLYRTSTIAAARIHVATFDAAGESDGYNRGNCEMVVRYLTQQPEVPTGYYWCEPGRFRPSTES